MADRPTYGSNIAGLRGAGNEYVGKPGFTPIAPDVAPAMPGPLATQPAPQVAPPLPVFHDVTIVTTRKLASAKVMGVPPEEFGIERGARSIRDCNYCFHEVVTKTEAQLIAEGFDAVQIKGLSDYTGRQEVETLARDTVSEHLNVASVSASVGNTATRLVKLTEHYVRMDYEGSGRPCLYQVITGGDQGDVLRKDGEDCITAFDAIPFAATTPVPITHRFFGRSIAELVMPLQREKTALKRGGLDNVYLRNNPRVEVSEGNAGPNTLDDLLVSRPGGVVRTKTPGGLNWQVVPDITSSIYPMMQYLDAELETRTGLSKQGQGIDANALQNQSATAVAQVFSASQMRIKLIARIMAEGVRDIFALLHGTIRKHGQQAQTVRLRNAWVNVDPRDWTTRDDMTINVGLGAGGKAQQFAQTMAIGNVQKEMMAAGKIHLVGDTQLYNTATELTRIMGHKNPDRFFNDPDAKDPTTGQPLHPAPPPQPSPEMIKAQAAQQIEQQKLQHSQELAQSQGQIELFKTQSQAQQDADKAKLDAYHQRVKTEGEIALARERAQLEKEKTLIDAQLKKELAEIDARMKLMDMEHQRELHNQQIAHADQLHRQQMEHSAQQHGQTVQGKQLDQKAKHAEVYPDHATAAHVVQLHDALTNHMDALAKMSTMPVDIIRDPKTGKATGVRRGNQVMTVQRGKNGRPEGLQ